MGLWSVIMWFLHKIAPDAPITKYFAEEVEAIQPQLTALEIAIDAAKQKLSPEDRFLLTMANAPLTQARAARRRFWKVMDPQPFADLYKVQNLTLTEVNKILEKEENAPGYFRKKVLRLLSP
jgi:hypothetical protein